MLRARWALAGLAAGLMLAGGLGVRHAQLPARGPLAAHAAEAGPTVSQPPVPVGPLGFPTVTLWARLAGGALAGGSGVTGSGAGTVTFGQPIANCAIIVTSSAGTVPAYSVLSDGMTLQLSDSGSPAQPVNVAVFC
jgi:hypothetical protein